MKLRYAGRCHNCGTALPAGSHAIHNRTTKLVTCSDCAEHASALGITTVDPAVTSPETGPVVREPGTDTEDRPSDPEMAPGVAGASARREHERRMARREQRIREAHPRIGGLILALSDEPQSTTAWAIGARGEELLAKRLDRLADQGVRLLHDRRVPRSRANIDHIAVGPSGVFVIDAKRYKGRPRLRVDGGLFRPRVTRLFVGTRDCTRLVAGIQAQVDLVSTVLGRAGWGEVPVVGMLCFVEADWPLLGGSFTVEGHHVLWPKKIAEHLLRDQTLSEKTITDLHRALAATLPPA
jgi:hypothetical protein